MMHHDDRLQRLRRILLLRRVSAFLVTGENNVRYLSGFSGDSGWILITPRRAFLITDFRYREQAEKEAHPDFRVVESGNDYTAALKKICRSLKLRGMAFEGRHTSYLLYRKLKEELKGMKLTPGGGRVEELRILKNEPELEAIRNSSALAVRALSEAISSLRRGMSEKDIANLIVNAIRTEGGTRAFEPIVASAGSSSQPHALSSSRRIKEGEILLVDLGAKKDNYNSDLTRTFALSRYPPRFQKLYCLVLEAQSRALAAISPGVRAADVDRAARGFLIEKGYGHRFGHALGHGVGLEIHEEPRLSSASETALEEGMVFTVEPGIYIPGWGGIRVEDTVRVTAEGYELLTPAPKDLPSVLIKLR